jgi:hypothetical protein
MRQGWFMRHYLHQKLCQFEIRLWSVSLKVDVVAFSLTLVEKLLVVSVSCLVGLLYLVVVIYVMYYKLLL